MSAAVAPLPLMNEPNDSSALARKRRREILLSQRMLEPDLPASSPPAETPALKRQKISHAEVSEESDNSDAKPSRKKVAAKKKSKATGKKPQMKYDPDVPMTKEEAAVWRREQRRKRNRESAAASRQRQRDRISELEVEVEDWKTKFDGIMERIQELEKITQVSVTQDLMSDIMALPAQGVVSPSSSPSITPRQSPTASPVSSSSLVDTGKIKAEVDLQVHQVEEDSEVQLLNKMISRPAVKITGATTSLLEDSMMLPADLCPDPCVSASENEMDEDDPVADDIKTHGLLLPDLEDEFGEFLLDAVTWL